MKGMIFAAGLGSRLRPLTLSRPKALVEAGGVSMLDRTIRSLGMAGVTDIVINAHHFASMVESYVGELTPDGMDIALSMEERLLDTGGGVVRALPMLRGDGPVMLHNVDIITDAPLRQMIEAHLAGGADVTLLAFERPSSRRLLFDGEGRMCGWMRVDTGQTRPEGMDVQGLRALSFGGVHILGERALDELERYGAQAGEVFSIVPFYADCASRLDIRAWSPRDRFSWFDIGSPERLAEAENWLRGKTF